MVLEEELPMKQLNFKMKRQKLTFGGADLKSNPKSGRPIDTKSATHLTVKASKGVLRLPKTMKLVNQEVQRVCKKYDFPLYKYSNNFNHLHLLIRVTNRHRWNAFMRELNGSLARIVKSLVKMRGNLWLGRPFTRIVKGWGRNYENVKRYIELNILEATRKLSRFEARLSLELREAYGIP